MPFCYPNGVKIGTLDLEDENARSKTFSFVLTDEKGDKR